MNIVEIGILAGSIIGIICEVDSYSKSNQLAREIKNVAKIEAANKVGWADEMEFKLKRDTAEDILNKMKKEEASKISKLFESDPDAKAAVKEFNKLDKIYEAAKKAVKNFKPDTVEVGVGAGENSASVSISNNSQKVILDNKLTEASAEREAAKTVMEDIRKSIKDKVVSERSCEYKQAVEDFKKCDAQYKDAVESNKKTVNSLLNDSDWTHKQFVRSYQVMHNASEIIGKACLMSILPVAYLIFIWYRASEGLRILKEVV